MIRKGVYFMQARNVADQSFDETSVKLQQKADSLLTEVDR
jgi:hypothetical protein